jgi:hypothetical protein
MKYCYDYWLESLMIGLISFYPALWLSTRVLHMCILRKDTAVVTSSTETIQEGSTLHQSLRTVNAQDGFISASPIYGTGTGRDVGVVRNQFLADSYGGVVTAIIDAIVVCMVCSTIVQLVWLLWYYVMGKDVLNLYYVFGIPWNGINAWWDECPFSLISITLALTFVIWWAHVWLFLFKRMRREKTEAAFTQSMVYGNIAFGQQGAAGQVPDGFGRPWKWFWQ